MTTGLSASGARIRGDDYQHLFAWLQVIYASNEASDIIKIGIEDPKAGNADDVTIYRRDGSCKFYQTKSSVDGNSTISMDLLIKPSKSGRSMIQKFHKLWMEKRNKCKLTIILVTNMLPESNDRLLSMRDGRDGTVVRILQNAKPESKEDIVCSELAKHLGITKDDVVLFFHDVRFMLGKTNDEWRELVKPLMRSAGLCNDDDAVDKGIEIVRNWVTSGKREIIPSELRQAVIPLRRLDSPTASILVQMIDCEPHSKDDMVKFDWTDLFPGSEAKIRRLPSNPTLWNDMFQPKFQQAAQKLRSQGYAHILVKGYMRLPTWFTIGAEFSKTAGFEVSSFQGNIEWSSVGELSDVALQYDVTHLGFGDDIAVGIALAFDLSKDVLAYINDTHISVGEYISIYPTNGANNQAIYNSAQAKSWAFNVRDMVRRLVQKYRPNQIHLFLSGPHSAILLLGHLWDRMPQTQLYEDLGSSKGYTPSFLIPG